jgi:prophage regulatory protein
MNYSTDLKISRKPEVLNTFGFEKSTLYTRIKAGLIPPPVSLGGFRAVGWIHHEIQAVLAAMCSGASQDQIKLLVLELISQRQLFK